MEGRKGGSSTPSYREVVVNKGKKPLESGRGNSMEEGENRDKETISNKEKKNDGTKDKEENEKNREQKTGNKRDCASPKLKSLLE